MISVNIVKLSGCSHFNQFVTLQLISHGINLIYIYRKKHTPPQITIKRLVVLSLNNYVIILLGVLDKQYGNFLFFFMRQEPKSIQTLIFRRHWSQQYLLAGPVEITPPRNSGGDVMEAGKYVLVSDRM